MVTTRGGRTTARVSPPRKAPVRKAPVRRKSPSKSKSKSKSKSPSPRFPSGSSSSSRTMALGRSRAVGGRAVAIGPMTLSRYRVLRRKKPCTHGVVRFGKRRGLCRGKPLRRGRSRRCKYGASSTTDKCRKKPRPRLSRRKYIRSRYAGKIGGRNFRRL